jgi:hypothetical protein
MTSPAALPDHTDRPALQLEPVTEAACAALLPPGPVRWVLDSRPDRVELRAVIRRWSIAVEPAARLARVASGTALRAARLAVAVQGREPLVSHLDQPGVLAVVHVGGVVAPRGEDLLLNAMLRHATDPTPVRVGNPDRTAVLRRLRRAAETEGAWLRALPDSGTVGHARSLLVWRRRRLVGRAHPRDVHRRDRRTRPATCCRSPRRAGRRDCALDGQSPGPRPAGARGAARDDDTSEHTSARSDDRHPRDRADRSTRPGRGKGA